MRSIKGFFLFCILLFGSYFCHAQNKKIDSLQNVLRTAPNDTNKVNTITRLFKEFIGTSQFDSATARAEQGFQLAIKLNYLRGQASGYNNKGIIGHYTGNFPMALENYAKSLEIREKIGD